MSAYLARHFQVLFATLGDMRRTPMSSFNTIIIIAITLLLPCLLYVMINSAQQLSGNWQGRPQMSIFLQKDISDGEAQLIFEEIRLQPAVALAEFVSPQQALGEFRMLSGIDSGDSSFDDELAFLGENPLPASIVVMPSDDYTQANKLSALKDQLSGFDGIEQIKLDLEWTARFNAILHTMTRISLLLSALLGIALILIVGNTIKLLIVNRRHEIEITKLVGGTDTFVRRPFLYYGTLFGLLGACITLTLLLLAAYLVAQPIADLAALYQSSALIYSLNWLEMIGILLIGGILGWLAARWSVAQHLRNINPR